MVTGWAWAYWPSGPFVGLSTFSGSAVISRRISSLPSGAGVAFGPGDSYACIRPVYEEPLPLIWAFGM